jgi:adenosylhomocysteine nucleosidase
MSGHAGVVAVTSLALEASIARGPGVSVVLCSQSMHLATRLKVAIAHGASGIISFGIAGGLAPHLAAGDCVVASAVKSGKDLFTTDRGWAITLLQAIPNAIYAEIAGVDVLLASPSDKHRVHRQTGALAADMESHIAARVAQAHRIPFAACRIVIDAAHRTLPPAAAVGLRHDGTPDVLAVLRSVLRQPGQLPDLLRTARDARIAEKALRLARKELGTGLGCPDYADINRKRAVA